MPEEEQVEDFSAKSAENEPPVSKYADLESLAGWIEDNLDLNSVINEPDATKAIVNLSDRVGDCLPIESGSGNGTIPQQLDFWKNNQQLFDKALKRRKSAADLVTSRNKLISKISNSESDISLIEIGLKYPESLIVEPGGKEKRIKELEEEQTRLKKVIEKCNTSLDKTENKFRKDKQRLKKITSRVDCKLPTVVTGHILKNMGWEVGLVCYNRPEHPSLIASKTNPDGSSNRFLVDFASRGSEYKGIPQVRRADNERYLTGSRHFAMQEGFIGESDTWPLPFNEDTFKKFDDWYVSHVENQTAPPQT